MNDKITCTLLPPMPDGDRVDTGPMQFGGDWPGIFMRGDYACPMGMMLKHTVETLKRGEEIPQIVLMQLEGLAETLQSCNIANMKEDTDGR